MVYWLQPYSAAQSDQSDYKTGSSFILRLTASLSLSAAMTFGSVSAAVAPAMAHAAQPKDVAPTGERLLDLQLPPDADLIELSFRDADLPQQDDGALLPGDTDRAEGLEGQAGMLAKLEGVLFAQNPIEIIGVAPITITPAEDEDDAADRAGSEFVQNAAAIDTLGQLALDYRPMPDPGELLDFDGRRVPRWLVDTILGAADATGVDPVYLMALADKESSFIPSNTARSSSAAGLFQFIASTWLEMVRTFGPKYGLAAEAAAIQSVDGQLSIPDEALRERVLGLRRDAYLSALMAAEKLKRDRTRIEQRLGRPISRSEYYLAHFFGVESASRFMSLLDDKPRQSAPRVFPAAARANRALFFTKSGRKTRQLTVAEVYERIDGMIDQRLDRYAAVKVIASADISL